MYIHLNFIHNVGNDIIAIHKSSIWLLLFYCWELGLHFHKVGCDEFIITVFILLYYRGYIYTHIILYRVK